MKHSISSDYSMISEVLKDTHESPFWPVESYNGPEYNSQQVIDFIQQNQKECLQIAADTDNDFY